MVSLIRPVVWIPAIPAGMTHIVSGGLLFASDLR